MDPSWDDDFPSQSEVPPLHPWHTRIQSTSVEPRNAPKFFCFFWGAGIIQTKKQQTHGNISRRSTFLPTKTLPKTNIFAPEKGCFEYLSFPFGVSAYFQGRLLLVSGRVLPKENMFFFVFGCFCHPFFRWVSEGGWRHKCDETHSEMSMSDCICFFGCFAVLEKTQRHERVVDSCDSFILACLP